MQNQALFTILVGGAAGIAASVAASLLIFPTPDAENRALAATPGEPIAAQTGMTRAEFQRELDGLRAENQMLAKRLRELEQARVWAEDHREVVEPKDDVAAAIEDQKAMDALAALADPNGSLPANLSEGVRQAFMDFRDEERKESEDRWAEARETELNARIELYTTELGLNSYQSEEMRVLLSSEGERRGELITSAREDGQWMSVRDGMRAIRDETHEGMTLLLTPDQLDRYDDMSRGQRFGPPGAGGGRGRDGGGDGGGGRRGER